LNNFCSPHVHIQSLDSASTPQAFAEREVELQTGAITVTDHGTLGACRKVYNLAKKNKLIPILGVEGYFRDDNCPILTAAGIAKDEDGKFLEYNKYYHFCLHAKDQSAYEAIVKTLSLAPTERHGQDLKPIFGWEDMERLGANNVTLTSGCLIGLVQRHLLKGRPDLAIRYYEKFRSLVKPGDFYVEIFPQSTDKKWEDCVFVYLADGQKLRYYAEKKLKTDKGEITATALAQNHDPGKNHKTLLAVKHYRTWNEFENPQEIIKVERVEGFIQNECEPWAPDGDTQLGTNKFMLRMAQRYGDKILVSDDSHFTLPEEKIVQDVRLRASGGQWRFYGSYHRQSSAEAFGYFKNKMGISEKQFEEWVDNSYAWKDKFKDFKFVDRKSLPTSFYPKDTLNHTMELIKKHGRMDWNNKVWVDRLNAEIDLLHRNGTIDLLPYFFIGEEACSLYEENGLLTGPGRGSAAGLLLAYLLGITHVDPLKYGLSMDRFLTIDRIKSGKLPDIDQDLPNRELLTDPETGWLKRRFGDCFAQLSVDTTLKLRSSIKDVARVLHGRVPEEIEELTKVMPMPPQGISDWDFVEGYEGSDGTWTKGIKEYDPSLKTYIAKYPDEWGIVQKCLGVARQKGRHASGYVITDEPVYNFIPTMNISGVRCTSYTMESVEQAGGIKMDFLVVNSFNDLGDCLKLVQKSLNLSLWGAKDCYIGGKRVPSYRVLPFRGAFYDIWDLPQDQDVFRMICESDTETVFQFNTPGAKKWLRQFNHVIADGRKALDSDEDLAAFTALDRPGPLDAYVEDDKGNRHNMLVEYAKRARGEPGIGEHPILNKMFPETFGIIAYQEQLQKLFQDVGKTTGIEANNFRDHISKKKMSEVMKDKTIFMKGAVETVGDKDANALWEMMETFGQYGFNKSHAVCYGSKISYACAFLKKHYPLEWWCAVLRNADKNEIDEKFWRFCGHLIEMPDIRYSTDNFEIQDGKIRAPISMMMGIGPAAHAQLIKYGPYTDVDDFCQKIEKHKLANAKTDPETQKVKMGHSAIHRGVVNRLILSGAMDGLFPPDAMIFDQLRGYEEALARSSGKKQKPIDPKLLDINPLQRFQLKKSVLPTYSEPILPMLVDRGIENIIANDKLIRYKYERSEYNNGFTNKETDFIRFATAADIERINSIEILPDERLIVATAAYVCLDRRFKYAKGTAAALTLDMGGGRQEFVKWPKNKTLPHQFVEDLTGAIAIVILTKYAPGKPFVIESLAVIQKPLEQSAEQSA
jgi:DNA polymerase-3 subunit alpha